MASFRFELGDGSIMPGLGYGTFMVACEEAEAFVTTALKLGYPHIDTAEGYHNESEVGKALKSSGLDRSSIFITTKLWPGNPAWGMPNKKFDEIIEACKQSVDKLGTSPDLYLIHAPFGTSETRVEGWKALVECQKLGLVKSIGVSNYGISHLEEIANAGLPVPAANQLELHPMTQKAELLAYMKEKKIQPIAYSSLAPHPAWRADYLAMKGTKTDDEKKESEPITAAAKRLGVSASQVLLRYALQKGWAILPKSTKQERIKENADLDSFEISAAEMSALDALECGASLAWDADALPGQHWDPTTAP